MILFIHYSIDHQSDESYFYCTPRMSSFHEITFETYRGCGKAAPTSFTNRSTGVHIRVLLAELICMVPVRCTDASPVFIIALTTTYWYDN
jgi:hypothetical protein